MKLKTSIISCFIIFCSLNYSQAQNNLQDYLKGASKVTIANSNQGIRLPRDLDFNPAKNNELWIANFGTLNSGANMIIISNAGLSNQQSISNTDETKLHFLNSTSALSFSNNGTFATCGELPNSPGDTKNYMGPALWETKIFGIPNKNASSHIDMLHESPFGMGIEAESANSYWLFDGMNGMICNYDFHKPHEPGAHDHSDGELARYSEVKVLRKTGIPSHLVRDRTNNWLYIVDGGNNRILRMDISSGIKGINLSCNEQYTNGCYTMKNVVWETYINTGLEEPSGIDIKNGILAVSDHKTGTIVLYDTKKQSPLEIGKINAEPGIMGIKIAGDNKIWYVNNKLNTVTRLDYSNTTSIEVSNEILSFQTYPNPANNELNIQFELNDEKEAMISIHDLSGREVSLLASGRFKKFEERISIDFLKEGTYILNLKTDRQIIKSKLIHIQKQ